MFISGEIFDDNESVFDAVVTVLTEFLPYVVSGVMLFYLYEYCFST